LSGSGRTAFANSSTVSGLTDSSPLRVVITVPCTPTQSPRSSRLIAANASSPTTALETKSWMSPERSRIVAKTSFPESRINMMRPGHGNGVVGLGAGFEVAPSGAHVGHGVRAIEAVGIRRSSGLPDRIDLRQTPGLLRRQPAAGRRRVGERRVGRLGRWGGRRSNRRCSRFPDGIQTIRPLRVPLRFQRPIDRARPYSGDRARTDQDRSRRDPRPRDRSSRGGARADRSDRPGGHGGQARSSGLAGRRRRGDGVQLRRTPIRRRSTIGGRCPKCRRLARLRSVGQRGHAGPVPRHHRHPGPAGRLLVSDGHHGPAVRRGRTNDGT
jgi:hypothetical protein